MGRSDLRGDVQPKAQPFTPLSGFGAAQHRPLKCIKPYWLQTESGCSAALKSVLGETSRRFSELLQAACL